MKGGTGVPPVNHAQDARATLLSSNHQCEPLVVLHDFIYRRGLFQKPRVHHLVLRLKNSRQNQAAASHSEKCRLLLNDYRRREVSANQIR